MPKLYYFDIYGVAESIRMALWHAKHPYEDIRLSGEEQKKMKEEGKLPAGQVPIWETDDGKVFNQSNAILHFIGAKAGLYGPTPAEMYWADWAIETVNDMWKGDFYMPFFAPSATEEQITSRVASAKTFIGQIEKRLANNDDKHFIAGEKISIGDIRVFAVLCSIAFNDGLNTPAIGEGIRKHVEDHAHVKAWFDRLNSHFAEYLAQRPKPRPL